MRRLPGRAVPVVAVALAALTGSVATAAASPAATQKWTKISTDTGLGIASAGLYRTADGRLHVVWARNDGAHGSSLHYSTVGAKSKLVNTGTVVSKWGGISDYPRLVAGTGGGIRLIFAGGNGVGGSKYNTGALYIATAAKTGVKWTLTTGSLSHSTIVPLTDTAAATQASGSPVAAWSGGGTVAYHVGIDPDIPATSADKAVSVGAGGDAVGPTLVRDKSGSIWAAWFNSSGLTDQGYYADKLVPLAAKVKAPTSGGKNIANNQPLQAVAFAARQGGGVYLGYCVPGKTIECTHIALWKAGANKAITVPGTSGGQDSHVAIAAAPGGHLWITWFDQGANKIKAVETNASATKFGAVKTIGAPPDFSLLDGLQAEGSRGTLDIIALILQNGAHSTPSYWDTQVK